MSKYRVSCTMRSDKDWSKRVPATSEASHPDLAKQALEKQYPHHTMVGITIEDLNPTGRSWDQKPEKEAPKPAIKVVDKSLDLDRTWRKELAR